MSSAICSDRWRSLALVAFLCLGVLGGCALPRSTLPVVKIGLIAPFEGLGRPLGYEVLYAVKLAVRERNTDGSLDGYRVALVALNDDDLAEHAERQARKLVVDSDVLGVIGPLSRATARAVAGPLETAGLAWLAPASAPDDVIAETEASFRLYAGDAPLAEAAIGAALAGSGQREVVVDVAGDFAEPLRLEAQRLGVLAAASSSAAGETAVALGGTTEQVARALPKLQGAADVIVAGPEAGRTVVVERAGAAADGLLWAGSLLRPDAVELPTAWLDGYRSLAGGPPGPYALLAYDAANLLLDAIVADIEARARPSRAGVLDALHDGTADGLLGAVSFDDEGSWIEAPVVVYRVSGKDIFTDPQAYGQRGR